METVGWGEGLGFKSDGKQVEGGIFDVHGLVVGHEVNGSELFCGRFGSWREGRDLVAEHECLIE